MTTTMQRLTVKENRPGFSAVAIEHGIRYEDGFVLTVEWSEEDRIWYAFMTGVQSTTREIGHGATKEEALCCLCCSLGALANALYGMLHGGDA